VFNLKDIVPERFDRQIAFNCLPHIADFMEDGYTFEEQKMIHETRKILHRPDLRVSATCVRVPVFYAHAEAVNLQLARKLTAAEARALLAEAPGIRVMDDPAQGVYPTQVDAAGEDDTFVGRIREDRSVDNGLDLWIVADNVRKGAALNAVQIAEILAAEYL